MPNGVADRDRFFEPIIAATDADAFWFETLVTTEGPELLSSLSDSFVRREPTTTPDGREFPYPYRKRLNCTAAALTDAFIEGLVLLIEKVVMHSPDIYLIFQMAFGGGEYQNSPKKVATAIPRRGLVFCFVFDLFYDTGMQARAEQLQVEMQLLIDTHFSPAQEQRLFWGSFGDTDITKQSVIDYYYDDPKTYPLLQLLKQRVDPGDTFHTLLTVKLPAVVPPPAGAGPPP